jgi:hypothetical protein
MQRKTPDLASFFCFLLFHRNFFQYRKFFQFFIDNKENAVSSAASGTKNPTSGTSLYFVGLAVMTTLFPEFTFPVE